MTEILPIALVNGKFMDALAVTDRGLAYGDGLFETLLWVDGKLPYYPLHLQRLQWGSERLAIPFSPTLLTDSLTQLRRHPAIAQFRQAVLKILLTRGSAGRGYHPPATPQPTLVVILSALSSPPAAYTEAGVAVRTCRHRLPLNPALAGIKHLNRLDYVLAASELADGQYPEGLLLDTADNVVEGVSRNLFAVKQQTLITPPLTDAGVAGVMRRLLVESIAPQLGLGVRESRVSVAELYSADEVFLTNSVTGIWPVRAIDDHAMPTTNPVTRQLMQTVAVDLQTRLDGPDV